MADINLLQNQIKDTTYTATTRTKWVVWIVLVLILATVGAGVFLYFSTKNVQTLTTALTTENTQLQQQVTRQKTDLAAAQAYQAKLSNLDLLLENHIAVSPLMTELEKYTYQRAQYLRFSVTQDTGMIHLEGVVDSYDGLGKLLLGLSTSGNFTNVKLLSISTGGENGGYLFSVEMIVAPGIFVNQ